MLLEMNVLAIGKYGRAMEGASFKKVLQELEGLLQESPEGGYFGGENLSRADILLEFPLSVSTPSAQTRNRFRRQSKTNECSTQSATQRGRVNLAKDFPTLHAWQLKCYARPAWKKSLEKGNGYDLTIFPKLPLQHS